MVQFCQKGFTLGFWDWPQHLQEAQVGDIRLGIECSGRTKGEICYTMKTRTIYIYKLNLGNAVFIAHLANT